LVYGSVARLGGPSEVGAVGGSQTLRRQFGASSLAISRCSGHLAALVAAAAVRVIQADRAHSSPARGRLTAIGTVATAALTVGTIVSRLHLVVGHGISVHFGSPAARQGAISASGAQAAACGSTIGWGPPGCSRRGIAIGSGGSVIGDGRDQSGDGSGGVPGGGGGWGPWAFLFISG